MFLTAAELVELTHKRRPHAQAIALKMMGIEHRRRPDGSLAVLTSHVNSVLHGDPTEPKIKRVEPNWAAI